MSPTWNTPGCRSGCPNLIASRKGFSVPPTERRGRLPNQAMAMTFSWRETDHLEFDACWISPSFLTGLLEIMDHMVSNYWAGKKTLSKQNDTRVATDRKKQMAKAAPGAAASTPHLGAWAKSGYVNAPFTCLWVAAPTSNKRTQTWKILEAS